MTPRDRPIVDGYVHHEWASQSELQAYMDSGWQVYLGSPGQIRGGRGQAPALPKPSYAHPVSDVLLEAVPEDGGAAGSDLPTMRKQLLDAHGIERAVLGFERGLAAPCVLNPYLGLEVARAANDWSIDRWLSGQDERLYGLALVPNQLPGEAATELRRVGAHERIVGATMGGNGVGKPFGNPIYHPIYEAAVELDLPIILHTGSEYPPNTWTHPTAGGLPSTYGQMYALRAQSVTSHLTSMIFQGVLERYPTLRVLVVGAGMTWIPGFVWRLDADFKAYGGRETPWVKRMPSEQFAAQVRVTTHSFRGVPSPERFAQMLETFAGIDDVLCFASGYPRWDADVPTRVAGFFPEVSRAKILRDNALDLFRWPAAARAATRTTTERAA